MEVKELSKDVKLTINGKTIKFVMALLEYELDPFPKCVICLTLLNELTAKDKAYVKAEVKVENECISLKAHICDKCSKRIMAQPECKLKFNGDALLEQQNKEIANKLRKLIKETKNGH